MLDNYNTDSIFATQNQPLNLYDGLKGTRDPPWRGLFVWHDFIFFFKGNFLR